jgi:hypothetical protein
MYHLRKKVKKQKKSNQGVSSWLKCAQVCSSGSSDFKGFKLKHIFEVFC